MSFIAAFLWNWLKGSWRTIAQYVGIAAAVLGLYFKGRSAGKKHEIEKQKDLTIDIQHRQTQAITDAPKTDEELQKRLRDKKRGL